ncbi:MAG: nucleotidyltransferase domain-containing protein [Defluviitaleaceae bacterium]|nr:nucleotidyltransferase domain-containing protein [Defluviitaleaceae bacterium]
MNPLLNQDQYHFIKTNPDLNNIIYLVLSGSRAYGTTIETSDTDLRGVLIEPPQYMYGLKTFEQFEDLPTDTVIYGLRKFAGLLAKANPNALELLGVDEDCIIKISPQGQLLRDNAHLFLSKRVISSFGNYALAQLRRLQNALYRDSYAANEQLVHLQNTLANQMDHFQRTYTSFPDGAINIYSQDDTLKFDITLKDYPVSDFVGIYSELSSIVKSYSKLNYRNRKKSDKGLYKHAMHLIRLLITGMDILNGKGILTNRKDEHQLLMDIRNGKIPFDEIFMLVDEYQGRFELAAKSTILPDEPDFSGIDGMLVGLYR